MPRWTARFAHPAPRSHFSYRFLGRSQAGKVLIHSAIVATAVEGAKTKGQYVSYGVDVNFGGNQRSHNRLHILVLSSHNAQLVVLTTGSEQAL